MATANPTLVESLTTALEVLQENYSSQKVADATLYRVPLWNLIRKRGRSMTKDYEFHGKYFVCAVEYGRAASIGAAKSDGTLPQASRPFHETITIYPNKRYFQISSDFDTLHLAGSSEKSNAVLSFANRLKRQIDGNIDSTYRYFNQQLAQGSGTGLIATASGSQAGSGTTASPYVLAVDNVEMVDIGDVIDISDTGDTTYRGQNLLVVNKSAFKGSGTISFTGTCSGAVSTDTIYRQYVRDDGYGELIGLPNIISASGTYPDQGGLNTGIDRSSNYWWQSHEIDAVNALAGPERWDEALDEVRSFSGNGFEKSNEDNELYPTQYIYTRPEIKTVIAQETRSGTRYQASEKNRDLGIPMSTFDNVPIIIDRDCGSGLTYFIDLKCMYDGGFPEPIQWLNTMTGESMLQLVPGTKNVWGGAGIWSQTFSDNPRNHAKVKNQATS